MPNSPHTSSKSHPSFWHERKDGYYLSLPSARNLLSCKVMARPWHLCSEIDECLLRMYSSAFSSKTKYILAVLFLAGIPLHFQFVSILNLVNTLWHERKDGYYLSLPSARNLLSCKVMARPWHLCGEIDECLLRMYSSAFSSKTKYILAVLFLAGIPLHFQFVSILNLVNTLWV